MKSLTKLGVSILSASLLSLGTASMSHAAEAKDTAKDDNRRVCKKYRPTGTRIAKKTCMTKRQWAELKRRAQEAARTGQRLGGHQNMKIHCTLAQDETKQPYKGWQVNSPTLLPATPNLWHAIQCGRYITITKQKHSLSRATFSTGSVNN